MALSASSTLASNSVATSRRAFFGRQRQGFAEKLLRTRGHRDILTAVGQPSKPLVIVAPSRLPPARRRSASSAMRIKHRSCRYGLEHRLQWRLHPGYRRREDLPHSSGRMQNLAGLRETEDRVARDSAPLGADPLDLAVDAWLNPNVEYAVRLGEMLRPYRIKAAGWLEDFLPADDLARLRGGCGLTAARTDAGLAASTGTASAFSRAPLQRRLPDILQPDLKCVRRPDAPRCAPATCTAPPA